MSVLFDRGWGNVVFFFQIIQTNNFKMGFDEGQIILDSENGAYYAGQTVFGRMVFSQDKVKTIHGKFVSTII